MRMTSIEFIKQRTEQRKASGVRVVYATGTRPHEVARPCGGCGKSGPMAAPPHSSTESKGEAKDLVSD